MNDDLFIRKAQLVLARGSEAMDLSQFKLTFQTSAMDEETPNTLFVRIYNLSESTVKQAINEYDRVILQAGYEHGSFGVIFDGTIKQFKRGKETSVDSYLDVMAANGDLGYNFGFENSSVAAGSSALDRLKDTAEAMGLEVDKNAENFVFGGILPRGKVKFGLGRAYARALSRSSKCRWSIQGNKLVLVPLTGYLPGEVVKLNSATGMVGVPEATEGGIKIRCLLNPNIEVGGRVQVNNKDINETKIRDLVGYPGYGSISRPASVAEDGIYRVLVIEHGGDTRGNSWYTELTCLAVDPSASALLAVKAYG